MTFCAKLPMSILKRPSASPTARSPYQVAARRIAIAVMAAGLWALPAPAQVEPDNKKVDVKIEGDFLVLSINEKDGLPLEEFIKLAQTLTKKVFTYSAADVSASPDKNITFIGPKRIRKDNFFAFFQTLLYIKGFALLVHGDSDTEVIEIIYRQGPKRADLASAVKYVTPEEIAGYANQTGVQILTSVPVEHIEAGTATNQLRPLFQLAGAGAGSMTMVNAAQSIILQGFGPQVYAAHQLLQLIDIPATLPEQEIRIVKLEYAAAEELEPILKEILEDRARRQQQVVGATGAPVQAQQGGNELKIVPHMATNTLLLSGTHPQVIEGQDLIARLDTPIEATEGDSHVISLKNVLAQELYETLNKFIQEDLGAEQQAQAQGQAAAARRPRKTVIVPHKESNSLLVSGTATKYKQILRVIDELDQRQPQVLIECAVVELTTSDSSRLGIELGLIDIKDSGDFTRPFGFTSFGFSQFNDTDGDGIPDSRLPDFENPLQGITGGIISNDDFAIPVLLNALAADSHANVLSLPSVVVNNNVNAFVSNQEERPQQQISQGNTTTTSGAGSPVSAGITLTISPSISSNNYLRLNVKLEVSRFLTQFDPNSVTAGVTAKRSIETQVTLPSGHTMVLGGVIEDTESDSSSGIPFLKDIPILGWLFSSWSKSSAKTNLYFFLTPYILDEDDFSDLAEQSFRKKLEASEYIGHRRIQLIDRKWRATRPDTLEDPGATIEDLDARGGFEIPFYQRPDRTPAPTGPALPTPAKTPDQPPADKE